MWKGLCVFFLRGGNTNFLISLIGGVTEKETFKDSGSQTF